MLRNMAWVRLVFYFVFFAHVDSPPVPKRAALSELELVCQAREGEVVILDWTLERETGHVLLYRDGQVWPNQQIASFSERVELKDPEFKSGNMNIIMKNVTSNDSGMYKCEAKIKTSDRKMEQVFKEVNVTVIQADELVLNQSGVNVTLQCCSPWGAKVDDLKWALQDESGRGRVLLHVRHGKVESKDQDPSFSTRVTLQDPELKSGNLTVLMKNVKVEDSGIYSCLAQIQTSDGRDGLHVHLIPLTVKPDDVLAPAFFYGVWWILAPSLILGVIVIGFPVYKKHAPKIPWSGKKSADGTDKDCVSDGPEADGPVAGDSEADDSAAEAEKGLMLPRKKREKRAWRT